MNQLNLIKRDPVIPTHDWYYTWPDVILATAVTVFILVVVFADEIVKWLLPQLM